MPEEIMCTFLKQITISLEEMTESIRILLQHYQVSTAEKEFAGSDDRENADTNTATDVDVDQIRRLLMEKSQAGKSGEVRELLQLFHADKLSDIAQKHYEELYRMAQAL